jgi:hypothetical protein
MQTFDDIRVSSSIVYIKDDKVICLFGNNTPSLIQRPVEDLPLKDPVDTLICRQYYTLDNGSKKVVRRVWFPDHKNLIQDIDLCAIHKLQNLDINDEVSKMFLTDLQLCIEWTMDTYGTLPILSSHTGSTITGFDTWNSILQNSCFPRYAVDNANEYPKFLVNCDDPEFIEDVNKFLETSNKERTYADFLNVISDVYFARGYGVPFTNINGLLMDAQQ